MKPLRECSEPKGAGVESNDSDCVKPADFLEEPDYIVLSDDDSKSATEVQSSQSSLGDGQINAP